MEESLTIRVLVLTQEVELSVKPSTTIKELKQLIQGRANIMFVGKMLTFNDQELKDEDIIQGINCTANSLIKVVKKA